jgi:hypothetical protein
MIVRNNFTTAAIFVNFCLNMTEVIMENCTICGVNEKRTDKRGKVYSTCTSCFRKRQKEGAKKAKETNLAKYGVENPMQLEESKAKIKQTMLEKYGVENPMYLEESKRKIRKTCMTLYGVDNGTKTKKARQKISDSKTKWTQEEHRKVNAKRAKTNLEKYGVDNLFKDKTFIKIKSKDAEDEKRLELIYMRRRLVAQASHLEKEFLNLLKEKVDKDVVHQAIHKGYLLDFYSPRHDVYIQLDGDYWHGYTKTAEELSKTEQGRNILATMKQDEEQNRTIPNLIRIRESEFKSGNLEKLNGLSSRRLSSSSF